MYLVVLSLHVLYCGIVLQAFPPPPLSTFRVFKSPGQLFCRTSLNLALYDVDHAWIQAMQFGGETTDALRSSRGIILRERVRGVCPITRVLHLIS